MPFEDFNAEEEVKKIVVDAVAANTHMEKEHVLPTILLSDIESLDLQEILIEIEEQCDALQPLEKRNLRIRISDEEAQKAKTVSDLIALTVASVESILREVSGDTEA